jgi:hypothetical protein
MLWALWGHRWQVMDDLEVSRYSETDHPSKMNSTLGSNPPLPEPRKFHSTATQVAAIFAVGPRTVSRWAEEGTIVSVKIDTTVSRPEVHINELGGAYCRGFGWSPNQYEGFDCRGCPDYLAIAGEILPE